MTQRTSRISDEVVDFVLEPLTKRHQLVGQDYADMRDALTAAWPGLTFTRDELLDLYIAVTEHPNVPRFMALVLRLDEELTREEANGACD